MWDEDAWGDTFEEDNWYADGIEEGASLSEQIQKHLWECSLDPLLPAEVQHGTTLIDIEASSSGEAAGQLYNRYMLPKATNPTSIRLNAYLCGESAANKGLHYTWFSTLLKEQPYRHDAIWGFSDGYASARLATSSNVD